MKTLCRGGAAFSLAMLAACVDPYGSYYGGRFGDAASVFGRNNGYCDSYGCPNGYWDMPIYYGSIYYSGSWVNGPFYYRHWRGMPQYWVRGGWRSDDWRGSRPKEYLAGRYGPPLGRDYYLSGRFRNEQSNPSPRESGAGSNRQP